MKQTWDFCRQKFTQKLNTFIDKCFLFQFIKMTFWLKFSNQNDFLQKKSSPTHFWRPFLSRRCGSVSIIISIFVYAIVTSQELIMLKQPKALIILRFSAFKKELNTGQKGTISLKEFLSTNCRQLSTESEQLSIFVDKKCFGKNPMSRGEEQA